MNFTHAPNKICLLDNEEQTLAEVSFPDCDANTVNICHTYVDQSLRGQGIADKLMKAVVEDLQSRNKKAVPTCSYAIKWFEEHPEYEELLDKSV